MANDVYMYNPAASLMYTAPMYSYITMHIHILEVDSWLDLVLFDYFRLTSIWVLMAVLGCG